MRLDRNLPYRSFVLILYLSAGCGSTTPTPGPTPVEIEVVAPEPEDEGRLRFGVAIPEEMDAEQAIAQVILTLEARFEAAQISARPTSQQADQITVHYVPNEPEVAQAIVLLCAPSSVLEFRRVDDTVPRFSDVTLPEGVSRETESLGDGHTRTDYLLSEEPGGETLRAFVAEINIPDRQVLLSKTVEMYGAETWRTYVVREHVALTNAMLINATAQIEEHSGMPEVRLEFNDTGRAALTQLTTEAVGTRIALILDSVVMSAPVVLEPVPGGMASISLGYSTDLEAQMAEARALVIRLRSGALPSPLTLISE